MRHPPCVIAATLLSLLAAAPAGAERIRIAGTGITLDAPPGFVLSDRFPGVQHEASQSSILVNELPAPIDAMTAGFTPGNLATRNMRLLGVEAVSVSGRAATLFNIVQSAGGIEFEKWIAALGDTTKSVLIVGTFPAAVAQSMSAPVRAAVLSTEIGRDAATGDLDGLPYRIVAPEGLEVQHRLQNMLLLGAPGAGHADGPSQPIAVVGASYAQVAITDLPAFARQRIERTAQVTGLHGIEGAHARVAGRDAYEITARASDSDSGATLTVYQMIVVDGHDYYITQGLVGETGAAAWLPRFRALARSMTFP